MSGMEIITYLTNGTYLLIGLIVLVEFLRYRDQARLDVLLMFGAFALLVLLQRLGPALTGNAAWTSKAAGLLFLAHPYLLLRLIQHLRSVPRSVVLFAVGGMLLGWFALLVFPNPLPGPLLIALVLYFAFVDGYATYAMVDGGLKSSGVVQKRLLLAAAGSGLIVLLVVSSGVRSLVPSAAPLLSPLIQLMGLFGVLSYFLAFAPPATLRRAWQAGELHRFLSERTEPSAAGSLDDSVAGLCAAALRSVNGQYSAIALWDQQENRLRLHTACAPKLLPDPLPVDYPGIRSAWKDLQPVLAELPSAPASGPAPLAAPVGATHLYAAPVATQERVWGVLLVFLGRAPLFARDDLELLALFCEQTAIALGYVDLLSGQEALIERLRRYNQRLQALKEIDRGILAVRSTENIAEVALDLVHRIVPFDRASVVMFDHEASQAQFMAVIDPHQLGYPQGERVSLDVFSPLEALSTPILTIPNASREPHPIPLVERLYSQGVRSLALVPLLVEQELIGVMVLSSMQPHAFDAEHYEIAQELSVQLAITLQQARLRAELQRTNELLEQRVLDRTAELEKVVVDLEKEMAARRIAGDALRSAEERLRYLLSSTPAMIYSLDARKNSWVTFLSENVRAQLGFEASQFLEDEHFWASRIHPDDASRVQGYMQELPQGEIHSLEYRFQHKDGHYVWMHDEFRLICDAQGNATEIVGYWIDVTSRREMEDAIQGLNEDLTRQALELQAANRELEAFAYSVSHDLRAPLRAIDGFSRILLDNHAAQLSEDAQRYLQRVRTNAQEMAQLIEDLLAFSRVNQHSLSVRTVEPDKLARIILNNLLKEYPDREVEIVIEDLPACEADPALLRQVLTNLLSNALKFSSKRPRTRIEMGCQERKGEMVYFIKDNGVGFDMSYVDKLFGVFQRLHRPEEYDGTGVGLAIVQRIIHRHGGRVWAEGVPDQGATFYFSLPK